LDKALYDDYLCLVASNKQQIQWLRSQRNNRKTLILLHSSSTFFRFNSSMLLEYGRKFVALLKTVGPFNHKTNDATVNKTDHKCKQNCIQLMGIIRIKKLPKNISSALKLFIYLFIFLKKCKNHLVSEGVTLINGWHLVLSPAFLSTPISAEDID